MGVILIVDGEPLICEVIGDYFRNDLQMAVKLTHAGACTVALVERGHYDLALIDVTLPGPSGLDLAALAANHGTPVLIISGHPETILTLHQFGYPYLTKPFSLAALRAAATRAMTERQDNVGRVKAAGARMQVHSKALRAAMAETDRSLDKVRRQQQLGRWITGTSPSVDDGP